MNVVVGGRGWGGGGGCAFSVGQTRLEAYLISYFANAAEDMGRNTIAVARRCATLVAVTDVSAVHTGKITGRQ
jgi:hypothetical protein